MADDEERGSNSLLSALAHPQILNPLAAYGDAAKVAESIWRTREWKARQAVGEAFQGSINPDGTPNQTKHLQNLQAAGPTAALAAQPSAQAGQDLDKSTFDTHMKRLTNGAAGFAQILAENHGTAPLEAVQSYLANGVRDGHLTQQEADNMLKSFGPDAVRNGSVGRQFMARNMTMQESLAASTPKTTMHNAGGQDVPLTEQPALSPNPGEQDVGGGPMIGRTQTPGELADEKSLYRKNADGTYTQVQSPRSDRPGAITNPTVTQLPRGGGGAAAPPVPSPIPGGGVYHPRGGATPNAPAPNTPTQAGAPPPVTAAPATPAPAAAPELLSAPPQGQPEALALDIANYKKAQTALPALQTSDQNMSMALDALARTYTGPGTDNTHALFAYLQSAGLLPPGATDEIKNNQLFRKLTERRVAELGMAAGTDAGRSLAQQSNAGTLLNNEANLEVLRNDVGKNRQAMLPILLHKNGGVGYGDEVAKLGSPGYVDFRGLNWDQYSGPEQAKILKSVANNEAANRALHRAIGMGHKLNFGAESKAP